MSIKQTMKYEQHISCPFSWAALNDGRAPREASG